MKTVWLHENTSLLVNGNIVKLQDLCGQKVEFADIKGNGFKGIVDQKPTLVTEAYRALVMGVSHVFHPDTTVFGIKQQRTPQFLKIEDCVSPVLFSGAWSAGKTVKEAFLLGFMLGGGAKIQRQYVNKQIIYHLTVVDPFGKNWHAIEESLPEGSQLVHQKSFNDALIIQNININLPIFKYLDKIETLLRNALTWDFNSKIKFLLGILEAHKKGSSHNNITKQHIYVDSSHLSDWVTFFTFLGVRVAVKSTTKSLKQYRILYDDYISIKQAIKIEFQIPNSPTEIKEVKTDWVTSLEAGQFRFYKVNIYESTSNSLVLPVSRLLISF